MQSAEDRELNGSGAIDSQGDDEIELEPTLSPTASSFPSTSHSFHMALAKDSLPSLTTETGALLRSRLMSASLFLALGYAVFFAFGLIDRSSVQAMAVLTLGVRVLLCAAVAGLLASHIELSNRQLRALEYVFFGLMILIMMAGQFVFGSELIRKGDFARLVAMENHGIINLLVLMILYAVFIPNEPRATARVVLTMALGPFLLLVALQLKASESATIVDQLASSEFAIGNMLLVLISAGLAIYTSHVLHHLRRDLHQARRLGQYQLGEKLGEGGMGEVYLAEHQLLKRPSALKMIKPDVNTNPIALARFEREVQTAAMLSNPNTIEIFDYGHTDDGTFYYVMEYLPGMSVSELVHQFGPMTPGRVVFLMRQVCGALAEAHNYGLVHRDLKPANIMIAILGGKCDVAKVLDFGLVKLTANPEAPQLTADYTVSGTPQYMSPEQATATELDGRADIYSVGAILYFMLTGRPPFQGTNPTELMISHARDPVQPPSKLRADVPDDLEQIVLRCLAKKPDDRFADARALSAALGACSCAGEWGDAEAEVWWVEQASLQTQSA
jgi:serine/threonine-protein kinase